MSTSGVVLTIDGREVEVAPGTGLVEAAAAGGIEIPIFCYEPRIGPAVGACRMCMVEIEGMPKLQTACSTPVRDGMVVSTVGQRAREAQEAVLEFLLVNHPLDCPVCDKGGECPLQDLTYRWGPGLSRFMEIKRTSDKPVPVSPLIALDRERCILCYRCTRFSSDVAQDGQLIARDRGGQTIISTFEGRPYEGHFSGNIMDLCPVGALTSTEYRFRARPWEITDHPSVCGLCPVGCNIDATLREGEVVRITPRRNDAVDQGWLCDKGRFWHSSLRSVARLTLGRSNGVDRSVDELVGILGAHLTQPGLLWVLSGKETCEEAYAISRIATASGGQAVALHGTSAAGPERSASLSDLSSADEILVIADADVVDIAPLVDLRIREAMRAGARVTVVGIGGTRLEAAGADLIAYDGLDGDAFAQTFLSADEHAPLRQRLQNCRQPVVVFTDGSLTAPTQAALVTDLRLERDGAGLIGLPWAPNSRGLAAVGVEAVGFEALLDPTRVVLVNIDPQRDLGSAQFARLRQSARWLAAMSVLDDPLWSQLDMLVPACSYLEKDGTFVNLDGRVQRLRMSQPPPVPQEISWLIQLAQRVDVQLPSSAAGVYRELAAEGAGRFPAARHNDIAAEGVPGVNGGTRARSIIFAPAAAAGSETNLYVAPALYDAAEVDHAERMQFLRDRSVIRVSVDVATRLGVERADRVSVEIADVRFEADVAISDRIAAGWARIHSGSGSVPAGLVGYHAATIEQITAEVGV